MARSLSRKVPLSTTSREISRTTATKNSMLRRMAINRRTAWRSTGITAALACLALSAVPQIHGAPGSAVAGSRSLSGSVLLADHQIPLSPLSTLGDLRGDWTGTGYDGAKISLTVRSPDALNVNNV